MFHWTEKRLEAAQLLADGKMSGTAIALKCGIARKTLELWRKRPQFQDKVAELLQAAEAALQAKGIADKRNRLAAYNRRWRKMEAVIEARAREYADRPQAATGLLARTEKWIGGGEYGKAIEEFAVDSALLKELRELEKQAAIEMNDWTEKRDITSDGQPVTPIVIHLLDNGREKKVIE